MNDARVFDFNVSKLGKSLKAVSGSTDSGRERLVPFHPMLIKLGLLKFVGFKFNKDHDELFWAKEKNCNDKFGSFFKRFIRYKNKLGVKPSHSMELKDFHSFRHLVRTKLSDIENNDGLIDDIIGHTSSSRSAIGEGYNHANRLSLKQKSIAKIKYPSVDFNVIKSWKYCAFNK